MQTFACHTDMQKSACWRSPWIPFPSPHHAKLASMCVRHASRRKSPVRPSLKKPAFRSAWLASLELGDATGIRLDKLLTVFNALDIGLFAQSDNDSIASPSEHPTTIADLPIANSNALPKPSVGRRPARQGTPSSYGALLAQIAAEQGLSDTSGLSFGCKVVK